jgi:phosphatidylserine decarboxylase
MFTKYGYGTIGTAAVIGFILIIISYFTIAWISILLIISSLLIIIFTLNFFRDPERNSPSEDKVIISPADGKVLLIKEIECDRFIEGAAKTDFNFYVTTKCAC